jgi:hypothetical protein
MSQVWEVLCGTSTDDEESLGTFDDRVAAIKLKDAVNSYDRSQGVNETCIVVEKPVVGRFAQHFTKYVHYNFLTGDINAYPCRPTVIDATTQQSYVKERIDLVYTVTHMEVYGYNEAIARERLMMILDDLNEAGYVDRNLKGLQARFGEE